MNIINEVQKAINDKNYPFINQVIEKIDIGSYSQATEYRIRKLLNLRQSKALGIVLPDLKETQKYNGETIEYHYFYEEYPDEEIGVHHHLIAINFWLSYGIDCTEHNLAKTIATLATIENQIDDKGDYKCFLRALELSADKIAIFNKELAFACTQPPVITAELAEGQQYICQRCRNRFYLIPITPV